MPVTENWKKDPVQDHCLDEIDASIFVSSSIEDRINHLCPSVMVLVTIIVYASDIWTAVNFLFIKDALASYFGAKRKEWFPYVFYFSISASILLIIFEIYNARRVLRTRDVALVYTDPTAHRFHVLLSYKNYCFFQCIEASRSFSDKIAFFVYFRLKNWKRLFFTQVPREVIKCYVIVQLLIDVKWNKENFIERVSTFNKNYILSWFTIGSLFISHLFFVYCGFLCILAALLYIPLVFKMRGNLKEYVCYKVDKRVARLLAQPRVRLSSGNNNRSSRFRVDNSVLVLPPKRIFRKRSQRHRNISSVDGTSLWSLDTVQLATINNRSSIY